MSSSPRYGSVPTPSQSTNDNDSLGKLSPTNLYVSLGQPGGKNKDASLQQVEECDSSYDNDSATRHDDFRKREVPENCL